MQPRKNTGLRHIQATVSEDMHRRLRELAYEQHRPLADLLLDATVLLLRFHDRGGGLPEPMAPTASGNHVGREATSTHGDDQ